MRDISKYEKLINKMIETNSQVLDDLDLLTLAQKTFKKPADRR